MYEHSKYNIKIDFDRSISSYVYDCNKEKYYLDFFNQYSTNPLGYNHCIYNDNGVFDETVLVLARNKIANCEMETFEGEEFYYRFKKFPGKDYKNFYFSCTGGLAVEAAIKCAINNRHVDNPSILHLKGSFHGITGLSMAVTDRFNPIDKHINPKYVPFSLWNKLCAPTIPDNNIELYMKQLDLIKKYSGKSAIALIIEPIQCTYGDRYFKKEFFKINREFCDDNDMLLIFDEVQTGFGATGKMWYYNHQKVKPDIVIFGKKAQVSGIMTNLPINYDMQEVTWDGNLLDMVRCTYVMKAISSYDLLRNTTKQGNRFKNILKEYFDDVRGIGSLCAIDLPNTRKRNKVVKKLYENNILCNSTRDKTIRFRMQLHTLDEEINKFENTLGGIYNK